MTVSSPDEQHEAHDERRAQLMGAVWLALWNKQGRGRGNDGAGSWIRDIIAPRENPKYEWIWIEPYLTTDTGDDLETYRGQQAGRALLEKFAGEVHAAAPYWFRMAKELAESTQEEWLFLTGIMRSEGWEQREGKTAKGQPFTAWTKSGG